MDVKEYAETYAGCIVGARGSHSPDSNRCMVIGYTTPSHVVLTLVTPKNVYFGHRNGDMSFIVTHDVPKTQYLHTARIDELELVEIIKPKPATKPYVKACASCHSQARNGNRLAVCSKRGCKTNDAAFKIAASRKPKQSKSKDDGYLKCPGCSWRDMKKAGYTYEDSRSRVVEITCRSCNLSFMHLFGEGEKLQVGEKHYANLNGWLVNV